MKELSFNEILEKLKANNIELEYIETIIHGEKYNCFDSKITNTIIIECTKFDYWKSKLNKFAIEGLKIEILYLGEKSNRPPAKNILVKMNEEELAIINKKYNINHSNKPKL